MHLLFAIDIFAILDMFSHTATNDDQICSKNETFFLNRAYSSKNIYSASALGFVVCRVFTFFLK